VLAVFGSEEELMLGSYYYAMHPLRPLDRTRAVLNLDMIGRDEAHIPQSQGVIEIAAETSNSMNLVGGYYSPDLVETLRRANRTAGLTLDTKFDNDYRLNTLFRCDHLPFLLGGVPSVWIFGGFHPGYHEPVDTMDRLNYPKIEKAIELAHRAAWDVADAATPPGFFRGK
jgi:Zn-dependent M28 family amino/carboxypeptidase